MKRIFSVFLAFVLVFTFVPFVGMEANAVELEEEGTYKIKYRPGSNCDGSTETIEYEPGEKAVLPDPSYFDYVPDEGYVFSGWKINSKTYAAGSSFQGEEGTYTATAQWKKAGDESSGSSSSSSTSSKKTYTVTYYPGDAEGSAVKRTYDYDENFTLISCPFEYENHKFVGWAFGDEVYDAGEKVKAPNTDVSFTAEWKSTGIEIIDGKVESISIKTLPNKTTYKVGESLDTTGLSIEVVNATTGATETRTSGFEVSPSGKLNTAGTVKITVTYREKTASFNVIVEDETSGSSSSSSKPSSSSSSAPKPSSSSSAPKPSSSSSSAPKPSSSSSSVPESTGSSSAPESGSSSVPEVPEVEVFEPVVLAFGIDGDIPVTRIEFLLNEEIGENPQLNVVPLDSYSVTDAAAEKFIAEGDALAAFDLSLLADGFAYTGPVFGTVTYSFNGTQASAESRFDDFVLAMVHTINVSDYEGDYYMTDGENTYIYSPETDFKSAVSNVKLLEEDGVNRLVIKEVTGLGHFAYQANDEVIVDVKLIPAKDDGSASIDVTSLSPVMLVQIEVGEGKSSGGGIPFWVWIIIAAIVLIIAALVVLFLINRNNENRRMEARRERTSVPSRSSSSAITGFDDEE